jgi:hypothetical protein
MTDAELKNYYANLLILQYREKPNAYETVKTNTEAAIINQLPLTVQDAFSLETAVGVQLDTVGKYIGASRVGYDFSGPVTLVDDDYRQLLKIKIIQNSSGSSLADIQNLIATYFPGTLYVFDYQDMRISYYFDSNAGTLELAQFFVKGGFLPKPMAVQMGVLIYAPVLDKFFGFGTYDAPAYNVTPFNTYSSYDMNSPWLNNSYAIILP